METWFLAGALTAVLGAAAMAIWHWRQARGLQARVEGLVSDAARLPDLESRLAQSEMTLQALRQSLAEASAREAVALAQRSAAEDAARRSEQAAAEAFTQRDASLVESRHLATRLAAALAERDAAVASREQAKAFLDEAQSKLRTAFIEAASSVFDEKAMVLDKKISDSSLASRTGLEAALTPFATRLNEFQAELRTLGTEQAASVHTLVGSIGQLQQLNQSMAVSADNLTRALKGNAKTRGDWGEMILDTVLKASGLEEGRNYTRQSNTRDDESGNLLRPDVLVQLPDERLVVVDSKVNLVAWAEACNAETPEAHREALLIHATALRQHLRELADKNYPKSLGGKALDLTILFVPIEGALAAALEVNPGLQAEAFEKKVVFASPNTLMAMLRVVERLWMRDKLQKQVGVIGEEAGKLLDALSAFIEEFDAIDERIAMAARAFKTARNRLSDSPQSVLKRAQRLVDAGARGKRALHEELAPGPTALPLLDVDDSAP